MTIMEVRVYRLRNPVVLQNADRYFGCFAWCDGLDSDVDVGQLEEGDACLEDGEFHRRQELTRDALQGLGAQDILGNECP